MSLMYLARTIHNKAFFIIIQRMLCHENNGNPWQCPHERALSKYYSFSFWDPLSLPLSLISPSSLTFFSLQNLSHRLRDLLSLMSSIDGFRFIRKLLNRASKVLTRTAPSKRGALPMCSHGPVLFLLKRELPILFKCQPPLNLDLFLLLGN